MKVSTAMVRPILETMYDHRREMVPCFIGAPGIGKTQGLYEFAEAKGVNVVTFILSNTVPSEVSGIRMPDVESKKMDVFDDMRMASLKDGDVLFFDEILEAPPQLWSACLTLIQDRIMASGRKLPDVFIVAASNRVASPAVIPASTRDRFQFIELQFDWATWSNWFMSRYDVDPDPGLKDRIQEDSDQYNILTPRRIVKLFTWMKQDGSVDDKVTKFSVIEAMFDYHVAEMIRNMASKAPTAKRQLRNAIEELGVELPDEFESMSFKRIMALLQDMPEWPQIAEALADIELEV